MISNVDVTTGSLNVFTFDVSDYQWERNEENERGDVDLFIWQILAMFNLSEFFDKGPQGLEILHYPSKAKITDVASISDGDFLLIQKRLHSEKGKGLEFEPNEEEVLVEEVRQFELQEQQRSFSHVKFFKDLKKLAQQTQTYN